MESPKNILHWVIAGLLEEKIRLIIFLKYQKKNININLTLITLLLYFFRKY